MKNKTFLSIVFFLSLFILCSCCTTQNNDDDDFLINADSFEMKADGTCEAKGNVEIITKRLTINSPSAVYTRTNRTAILSGPVIITFTNNMGKAELKK